MALVAGVTLCACAGSRSAMRQDVDFSLIKTVGVDAKPAVAAFVSRELLRQGVKPLSGQSRDTTADALLSIVVTRQTPEKNYVIRPGKSTQQTKLENSRDTADTITVTYSKDEGHAPIEVPGRYPYVNTRIGSSGEVLVASYAQALVTGELVRPGKGDVLWAGTYTYEGFDLESALEGAVRGLILEIPFSK